MTSEAEKERDLEIRSGEGDVVPSSPDGTTVREVEEGEEEVGVKVLWRRATATRRDRRSATSSAGAGEPGLAGGTPLLPLFRLVDGGGDAAATEEEDDDD